MTAVSSAPAVGLDPAAALVERLSELDPEEVANVTQDADLARPVRVKWIDSGLSLNRWLNAGEVEAKTADMLDPVITVGLWMGENEHVVMIGQSHDAKHYNWQSAFLIWKPSIVSKEWLS